MPCGPNNAPSVFQTFVTKVLGEMLNQFVTIYYILMTFLYISFHVNHDHQVLEKLMDNHQNVNLKNCEFHHPFVSFSGYVLNCKGVKKDEKKL